MLPGPPLGNAPPPPGPGPTAPGGVAVERRGRRQLVALCLVALALGSAIGIVVGRLLFSGSADDTPTYAEIACQQSAQLDPLSESNSALNQPPLWVAQGIGNFAEAAARDDAQYEQLGKLGIELLTAATRVQLEEVDQAVERIRSVCADLDW